MDKTVFIALLASCVISGMVCSCVGGVYDGVTPYPYPQQGNYESPPIVSWPDFSVTYGGNSNYISSQQRAAAPKIHMSDSLMSAPNLQIAYQSSVDSRVENLVGLVTVDLGSGYSVCSAVPIKYDPVNNQTVLITAAHCVTENKTDKNAIRSSDLYSVNNIYVSQGIHAYSDPTNVFNVEAVYVPTNYCQGSQFLQDEDGSYFCPNLKPKAGTEGNDIAVMLINGKFGNPDNYAMIEPLTDYPKAYTKANVLSAGFGVVNDAGAGEVWPSNGIQAFAVSNYYYGEINAIGYHYMLNSYFEESHKGYAALVCSGDSGGPDLFFDGNKHSFVALSIHTYGPSGVCGGFYKHLYTHGNGSTNIGFYYPWIEGLINNLQNSTYCSNSENNCVLRNN